jgi:hypothetical protein
MKKVNIPCISNAKSISYYVEQLIPLLTYKDEMSVLELGQSLIVCYNHYNGSLRQLEHKTNKEEK